MSWLASLLTLFAVLQAGGAPSGPLENPEEEARAQALMREIRCVACENEPISQSASDIAEDMRRQVRQQVASGMTDAEIRDWFAQRYEEFVLLRPRANSFGGVLLWTLPFVLLVGAGLVAFAIRRRKAQAAEIDPVRPESIDP